MRRFIVAAAVAGIFGLSTVAVAADKTPPKAAAASSTKPATSSNTDAPKTATNTPSAGSPPVDKGHGDAGTMKADPSKPIPPGADAKVRKY